MAERVEPPDTEAEYVEQLVAGGVNRARAEFIAAVTFGTIEGDVIALEADSM